MAPQNFNIFRYFFPARQKLEEAERDLEKARRVTEKVRQRRHNLASEVVDAARDAREEMPGKLVLVELEHLQRLLRGGDH